MATFHFIYFLMNSPAAESLINWSVRGLFASLSPELQSSDNSAGAEFFSSSQALALERFSQGSIVVVTVVMQPLAKIRLMDFQVKQ